MLDRESGEARFVCEGAFAGIVLGADSGRFAGNWVVHKKVDLVGGGRLFRYYLLDPDGNEVGEIGDTESALQGFLLGIGVDF